MNLLLRLAYWWVGPEWIPDTFDYRMVRRRPDGTLEYREMSPEELDDEMKARAW